MISPSMAVSMCTRTLEAALVFGDRDTGENENNISLFAHAGTVGTGYCHTLCAYTKWDILLLRPSYIFTPCYASLF